MKRILLLAIGLVLAFAINAQSAKKSKQYKDEIVRTAKRELTLTDNQQVQWDQAVAEYNNTVASRKIADKDYLVGLEKKLTPILNEHQKSQLRRLLYKEDMVME